LRNTRIPQAAAGRPKPAARGLGATKIRLLCGTARATAFFGKNEAHSTAKTNAAACNSNTCMFMFAAAAACMYCLFAVCD
jgi:hypothetical protein